MHLNRGTFLGNCILKVNVNLVGIQQTGKKQSKINQDRPDVQQILRAVMGLSGSTLSPTFLQMGQHETQKMAL